MPSRFVVPQRVADLALRGTAGSLWAKITWPAASGGRREPGLLVLFADAEAGTGCLSRGLSRPGLVVLSTSARSAAFEDAVTIVEWAAAHASELDADPARLLVAGHEAGAELAAALALHARDRRWPVLARQVLIHPQLERSAPAAPLAGVAPATVVTAGPSGDDGAWYGARLRQAGVEVDELRLEPTAPLLDELTRALARADDHHHHHHGGDIDMCVR